MKGNEWSLEKARVVYGINKNDLHFLDVNEDGELFLRIGNHTITFREITEKIQLDNSSLSGYTSSFTLRIPQLIAYQLKRIRIAFETAIRELNYPGKFQAVYPVKVNQRKDCVTAVIGADKEYGLEAGTKAELLLIKRVVGEEKHRRIVCNGAKDPEYLQMIRNMIDEGYHMTISVESLHEAYLIIEQFLPERTEVVLRMKPYISVEGHWSHSTGRDSKFGLSIHDLFDVVELFKKKGFASSITTILAHIGSQIENVESFRRFGRYMTRVYLELHDLGLSNLKIIDFGGGLAIDYTSSNRPDLMETYALRLLQGIMDEFGDDFNADIAPDILIESGRGITALGALIIIEALEVRSVFPPLEEYKIESIIQERNRWIGRIEAISTVKELVTIWNEFHDSLVTPTGELELIFENEMLIGELEAITRQHIVEKMVPAGHVTFSQESPDRSFWHPEHIVIGNFSVFNAIGDFVLVQQHFPAIPIADLHVHPQTTVRLVDITCDSDGEFSQVFRPSIDKIWFSRDNRPLTMPGSEYGQGIPVGNLDNVMGSSFVIPLTGAYQDVIEMDHNLLGDLPDVEILVSEEGEWSLHWIEGAETMEDILEDVGYQIQSDEDPYMSDGH